MSNDEYVSDHIGWRIYKIGAGNRYYGTCAPIQISDKYGRLFSETLLHDTIRQCCEEIDVIES
jgi:hypothetical protein